MTEVDNNRPKEKTCCPVGVVQQGEKVKLRARKKDIDKTWRIRPVWDKRQELARQLHLPELIVQLLYNRGLEDVEQCRSFLQPSLNDLIEPGRLSGTAAAVQRIRQAICAKEKIVLYGDYDVDGIVGVAILWRCLKLAGVEVDYYVPHRIDEGYGLNAEAIEKLSAEGTKLIVTVDCGISAHAPAALARQLGIDLVITDHHKIDGRPAEAVAIVHPNLAGQNYANANLCGAGVALKLAWALAQEFSGSRKVTEEFRRFLLSATALAALGTIADVVPLLGENRVLAKYGLEALACSEDSGIKALIKASGLEGKKLQSVHIGFRLAPRLNAAGRMGHARLALELFTRSSPARAEEIAAYLEAQNHQRQKVEKQITEQALEQVKRYKMDGDDWRGLVLAEEQWHGGVIGIVASRIVDKYRKPAVVISIHDDEAMGSCRSIPGFDIYQALENCSQYLLGFGGHAMAAGLTMASEQIEDFRAAFNKYACEHLDSIALQEMLDIDAEVCLPDLTLQTMKIIEQMEPFGAGNPKVRLLVRNLQLIGLPRKIGSRGDHLQFLVSAAGDTNALQRPGGYLRVVAFGKAKWDKKLIDAQTFDLVAEPVINRFNGNTTVEMLAEDIKITG